MIICGREFDSELIARLNQTGRHLSRRALSLQLCQWINWKGPSGKWQTSCARVALRRLELRGELKLPAPAAAFSGQVRRFDARPAGLELRPLRMALREIEPVALVLVGSRHSRTGRQCRYLLENFHPLGTRLCGAQLRYLITSARGVLGVLTFSGAARRLRARDQWIGWSDRARAENLHRIVNNSRFLIRPGVEVPHLASRVLAMAIKRLPADWEQRHGYQPWLLETFVEKVKYQGVSYRASNWIELDEPTAGRGRQDSEHQGLSSLKRIFVYPLLRKACDLLGQLPDQPRLARVAPTLRPKPAPQDWAEEEFGGAELGDQRLYKRLLVIARDCYARPQSHVPQSCDGDRARAKAAYRFFDHPNVSMEKVLESHYIATTTRVGQQRIVIAAQDTTSLNYSLHPATQNLGPISTNPDGAVGLFVHDTMAFTVEGNPLGLVDVQCWARDPSQFGKRHRRYELPFEAKESAKWLRSLQAAERMQSQCPQTQIVSVGDREADIYELFVWAREKAGRPHLLIRAEHNRRLADEHGHLWEQMAAQPVAGSREVQLLRRAKRLPRRAHLEVRFGQVELRAPKTRTKLPNVSLWAVWARERGAPAGVEPVEWMLLTTLPVENLEQACEKLDWYTRRWGIEVFHRTLKSGCKIETRQLGHADRIQACLAIDLVVAWRIFHLSKLGREAPDVPCTVFFEPLQWQALVGFIHKNPIPPPSPPTLRQALRMVASLGGFLGRKGDGEPGTQTLWLGLQRLDDISQAWKVFSQLLNHTVSSNRTYG